MPFTIEQTFGPWQVGMQSEPPTVNFRTILLGGTAPVSTTVVALWMGQSEMEYLLNNDSSYRQIPQPSGVPDGNLIVYTQQTVDPPVFPATIVKTVVNPTTVAAGQVNPAMAAMAVFLDFARPGYTFVVGDGCVQGTGRPDLYGDSEVPTARFWGDFENVINAVVADYGAINTLIECWYNSDAARIDTFKASFWPFYFGVSQAGATWTQGTPNPAAPGATGVPVDHFIWDATAPLNAVGRGVLPRSSVTWRILTPMPFFDAPVSPTPELDFFSQGAPRLIEPARQVMIDLAGDSIAGTVNIQVGPSAHIANFNGGIHPITAGPDGQILLMWPFALAMLRQSGTTINEPTIVGIEGASDGSYADLVVDLPNGGNLTTIAAFRGGFSAPTSPHRQDVIGVEVARSTGRRPVYNTAETSYPASARGTVTIVDSGSGSPRRGRVRVTPTAAFVFGDTLSYLRGQATAALQEPRDNQLYPWFLIEHIPSLYQAGATYPFEGVAVRPYQADLLAPVTPPAFTPTSAYFGAAGSGTGDYYLSTSVSQLAGQRGLISVWLRLDDTSWGATARCAFDFRAGTAQQVTLITVASGSRMQLRLQNDSSTAPDTFNFYAGAGTTAFVVGQWYHIMASWTTDGTPANSDLSVYVNGVKVTVDPLNAANVIMNGQNLTRVAVGANAAAGQLWKGDIASFWFEPNLATAFDINVLANRQKFVSSSGPFVPVDLGPTGQLPTGSSPRWYYEGNGPAFSNKGTAGNIPLVGALVNSSSTPSY
jgi:hypothetical protein